jgi:carbon storage regulator
VLVLSRRPGESIVIGNQVVVTVLEVRGDQVRIGVDAPREVQVHREEVFRQLEAENAQAAGSALRAQQRVTRARLPGAAARRDGDRGHDGPTSADDPIPPGDR